MKIWKEIFCSLIKVCVFYVAQILLKERHKCACIKRKLFNENISLPNLMKLHQFYCINEFILCPIENCIFVFIFSVCRSLFQFFPTHPTGFCQLTTPAIPSCTPAQTSLRCSISTLPGFSHGRPPCLQQWWITPKSCWWKKESMFPRWRRQIRAVGFEVW